MEKNAYAKINLTLEILGKREDGFHELRTVMHKITLCDVISCDFSSSSIRVTCSKDVCDEKDNLAYRAACAYLSKYREKTGKDFGVRIHIEKNIPEKAGLAGGSSDCACVLDLLNEKFGALSEDEVFELAASLGSDVPFCLERYTCALCRGRGTKITKNDAMNKNISIVVAMPYGGLSTKGMYALYDESPESVTEDVSGRMLCAISNDDFNGICSNLVNHFTRVAQGLCPKIKELSDRFDLLGADARLMSGSGASVFGLFRDKNRALECANELKKEYFCVLCSPCE